MNENIVRCPSTMKLSFVSEEAALLFEDGNRKRYPDNPQQYAYACEDCSNYHLTAQVPGMYARTNYSKPVAVANSNSGPKGIDTNEIVRLKQSGLSVEQITKQLDITVAAVYYHLRKGGVELKPGQPAKTSIEEVVQLRKTGKTYQEIADELNISPTTVYKYLTKTDPPKQLVTYEDYRDRRIELDRQLVRLKQEHKVEEQKLQETINGLKKTEDRLFEERSLRVSYGTDGATIIQKDGRQMSLTAQDLRKLLAEAEKKEQEQRV